MFATEKILRICWFEERLQSTTETIFGDSLCQRLLQRTPPHSAPFAVCRGCRKCEIDKEVYSERCCAREALLERRREDRGEVLSVATVVVRGTPDSEAALLFASMQ
jgi:hypothetical protein